MTPDRSTHRVFLSTSSWLALSIVTAGAFAVPASAQASGIADADRAFAAKDWERAAKAYRLIVTKDVGQAQLWFKLGGALFNMGEWSDAVGAFRKAAADPKLRVDAYYNIACAQSRSGDGVAALESLREAIQAGFRKRQHMQQDPDLVLARETEGFSEIEALLGPPIGARLPKVEGDARQFDAWLGEWDAVTLTRDGATGAWVESGKLHMRIEPALAGQVVLEFAQGEMVSGQGKTLGFSARSYDPKAQEWNLLLLWPSPDAAKFSHMTGGFRHGRGEFLVFWPREGEPDGALRYTFSDIGADRLRWDSARSLDGAQSWSTSMIFEFARRGADAEPLGDGASKGTSFGASVESRVMDWTCGARTGQFAARVVTERPIRFGAVNGEYVRATTTLHLEGALLMTRFSLGESGGAQTAMEFAAYDTSNKQWVRYTIEAGGPRFTRWTGKLDGVGVVWETMTPDGLVRETMSYGALDAQDRESVTRTRQEQAADGAWEEIWSVRMQ